MPFFLQYAPQSDFEQGIFVPFETQAEAERQSAYDLLHGADPDYMIGVFQEALTVPKFGWLRSQMDEGIEHPHLKPRKAAEYLLDSKKLVKAAQKHIAVFEREHEQARIAERLATHEAVLRGSHLKANQPGSAWAIMTGGTATGGVCALVAATAKTVVLVTAGAADQPLITEIGISFDGVTASAVPVLVELVSGTAGTAGTSTSQTPKQVRGWPAQTPQTTGNYTYTAEPTTQLVNRKWLITPNGGVWAMQYPLGREPTGVVSAATDAKTYSLRATAPANVNCHAHLEFEE